MTDHNPTLSTFRKTLRDGNVAAAMQQFDSVEAALQEQEAVERTVQTVARGTIARTPPSDQANTIAQEFVAEAFQAEQRRLSFNLGFLSFAGGNLSAAELADRVDRVIEIHEQVNATAEELRAKKGEVPLPLLLSLTGSSTVASAKGGSVEREYTLENFGNTAIEDISVSVDGYDLAASPTEVETLGADDAVSITLAGATAKAGEFTVALEASGDGASDTVNLTLTVRDKQGFLDRALATIEEVKPQVEALDTGGRPPRGGSAGNGLLNKLTTAEKRLNRIQSQLERGPPSAKAIDNEIEAVINLVETCSKQVEGLKGSQLSAETAGLLRHDFREIIAILERGVIADV